jgi:hypothetical protein
MIHGIHEVEGNSSTNTPCKLAVVDAQLQTFRQHLHSQIQAKVPTGTGRRLGIRCSVVPVAVMSVSRDMIEDVMADPPRRFVAKLRSGDLMPAAVPIHAHNLRTILRGLRVYFHHESTSYAHELFLDGTQNITFVHKPPAAGSATESDDRFAGWTLGVTTSALRIAAATANACACPDAEFCLEVQICLAGGGVEPLPAPGERRLLDYRFESIATTFPQYFYTPARGPVDVLNALLGDLYRSSGLRHSNPIVAVVRD